MRDPYDPYADELAAALPDPPPKNLDHDLDPPPDYQGAAARGMTAIRNKMGWTQPTTPQHPVSPAHGPHSPSNQPPNGNQPPPKPQT